MIINHLYLDHFGKFHHREIDLKPGINLVYGPNESGKSTIHTFIQCMFFGAERLRGRGAAKDIYTKYQPWLGQTAYEGRMNITCQGRTWRLVRNFYKDQESFSLIDEQAGRDVAAGGRDISALIENMNLSNYKNSLSIGQLAVRPDSQFASDMQSYMANMSMSADAAVDVAGALAYLKEERKKAAAAISEENYTALQDKADALKKELSVRDELREKQQQMDSEKQELQKQIRQLEARADASMKADRQERMKAIQLIQENNDVAAMYKSKKAELREMEALAGNQGSYQKRIREIMADYDERKEQLEDSRSRLSELEEQNEGNGIRNLALIFPAAALSVILWIAGGLFGLEGIAHMAAALLATLLTALLTFFLIKSSGARKSRIEGLQEKIDQLEEDQQAILDKYEIDDINELREKDRNQHSRQEAVQRLRKELEGLRRRYDALQGPLAPYLEKYGDTVTLESAVGQEEKKQMEQLRRQSSEIGRQVEQLEWQMEQLNLRQAQLTEVEEQLQQLKADRKSGYEDMMAIDISQNAIKEIVSEIHGSFGSQLSDYVSELFQYITDGAHGRLTVDDHFQVQLDDGRQLLQPQQLSMGAADQIYFAMRMAASQMLFDEPMPLILDDSFYLYDDERLSRVLNWLAEQTVFSQIIIFSCHRREGDILAAAGHEYHLVEL